MVILAFLACEIHPAPMTANQPGFSDSVPLPTPPTDLVVVVPKVGYPSPLDSADPSLEELRVGIVVQSERVEAIIAQACRDNPKRCK